MREFHVVFTQDEEGYFVAEVSELSGCHTQAKSHDELMERIKETIELYLDVVEGQIPEEIKIIETQAALT
jgi:predicted RNase H-like HicB family nuclease